MSSRDTITFLLALLAVIVSIAAFVVDGNGGYRRLRYFLGGAFLVIACVLGAYGVMNLSPASPPSEPNVDGQRSEQIQDTQNGGGDVVSTWTPLPEPSAIGKSPSASEVTLPQPSSSNEPMGTSAVVQPDEPQAVPATPVEEVEPTSPSMPPNVISDAAFGLYHDQSYKKAAEMFTACIQSYPSYGNCYHGLGMALRELGDYRTAINNHSQAITMTPKRSDYWFERGVTYLRAADYENAMSDFTECIRLKPSEGNCYVSAGIASRDNGNLDTALRYMDDAISISPTRGDFYWERAVTFERLGDVTSADADYRTAEELGYNNR